MARPPGGAKSHLHCAAFAHSFGAMRDLPVIALLAGLGLLALAAPLSAQQPQRPLDHEAEYEACMQLARHDPRAAEDSARAWLGLGGGEPAKHCISVSLIGQQRYAEAAEMLENLAADMKEPIARLQSEMMAQAGQAWMLADNSGRALQAQSKGLTYMPENIELLVDRSITHATRDEFWEAVDDLDKAYALDRRRTDVLVLRASAYRRLEAVELALDDLNRALEIDPGYPEGLLERGIVHRMMGNDDAARQDWNRIVSTVPGTPAAEIARRNLDILENGG